MALNPPPWRNEHDPVGDFDLDDLWQLAIAGYMAFLAARGVAATTQRLRVHYLGRLARAFPDGPNLTEQEVVSFLAHPGWAAETRKSARASIVGFYRWAARSGLVDADPTSSLPAVRVPAGRPRPAPDAALQHALDHADDRTRLMLMLAAYAGLRRAEIAELHAEDVTDGQIWVRGQKGGGVGCVPLHPTLAQALAAWPVKSGPLWPTVEAHYVSERCNYVLHKSGSAATMHATRHAYGTNVYRASGGSLIVAQQLLRHASPATTAVYVQVADDALSAAVCAIPAA